jgi:subtilisin family serine protease
MVTATSAGRRRGVRASQGIKTDNSPNTSKVRDSVITGTIIVDVPDEEAERMRRELPDVVVLRDTPIDLIRPGEVAATLKRKVTASDLWHLEAIGLKAARKQGFRRTGTGVTIAVLDTGIDQTHVELSGKVVGAFTFDASPEVWAAQPMIPPVDTDGHGTHVAGLICGKTVGVAPGANLLSGVMIPGGRGMVSDFVLALEWAASRSEIQIVNMSAGIRGYTPEMHSAIEGVLRVGVLPVSAVGNEGRNRTRSPGNYSEVVSVGAADRRDGSYGVAGFSGGGTLVIDYHQYQVPDVVAPGKGVYSSIMGGEYAAWDGTSMAAPIVSGLAALILERNPNMDPLELEDELLSTCLDLGLPVDRQGSGLVQIKVDL